MTLTKFLARKSAASLFAIGIAVGAGLIPTAAVNAAPAGSNTADGGLILSVGASRAVNVQGRIADVVVVNPAVADVFVRSNNQIYILAKGPGETTVSVINGAGQVLYSTVVRVGNNLTTVDQMLKLAMPDADIQVSTMNGMILLTGTIKAPEDAAEAERLTQAFVSKDVTVVSRLRTATPLQVNLQVRIAEVSRNLVHQIGTNISGLGTGSGSFSGFIGNQNRGFGTFGSYAGPVANLGNRTVPLGSPDISRQFTFNQPGAGAGTSIGFLAKLFGMDIAGALDLAETSGLATSLAQPNLTSLSGETASFLAGGEYPYQVINGVNGNSIEFKQYGVQLAFTPTVLSDGRISMRVRPTVSTLDFSINSSLPALRSRSVETTVELGSGQSFMIGGLLLNDSGNNVTKVPGLGNIPILGSLFKSRNFQRNETELVVVITPYLVKPVNASDIHLPTDGFRSATEAQGLIKQQMQDSISGARMKGPTLAPDRAMSAPVASTGKPTNRKQSDNATAPGFSF